MIPRKVILLSLVTLVGLSCATTNANLPRASYTLVLNDVVVGVCSGVECKQLELSSMGSGVIVASHKGSSWGITAGHVCKPKGSVLVSSKLTVVTYEGSVYAAELVGLMESSDICVIKLNGVSVPASRLAPAAPKIGDKVYSLASPLGIFDPKMVLQLDGYYCGKKRDTHTPSFDGMHKFPVLDSYSIPATGGSSGGGIFNSKGELIGMTLLARGGFENFTLSIQYSTLAQVVRAIREAAVEASK